MRKAARDCIDHIMKHNAYSLKQPNHTAVISMVRIESHGEEIATYDKVQPICTPELLEQSLNKALNLANFAYHRQMPFNFDQELKSQSPIDTCKYHEMPEVLPEHEPVRCQRCLKYETERELCQNPDCVIIAKRMINLLSNKFTRHL